MNKTAIEYLTHTWNPIAMRCTPVSEGCKNCWHIRLCKRHAANPLHAPDVRAAYAGGEPVLLGHRLNAPLRRRKPAMIGVQFMGDLFHEDVPDGLVDKAFAVMLQAPQHTYQVLTKRAKRMETYVGLWGLPDDCRSSIYRVAESLKCSPASLRQRWPLANLWLGVTAENQQTADERIPLLLQTPAAVRFVSIEPMLGPVDIEPYLPQLVCDGCGREIAGSYEGHIHEILHDVGDRFPERCGAVRRGPGLNWVICGAETGPGKRPMELDWVCDVRDQCSVANVPFFFKRDSNGSRLLDGRKWEQYPETNK